MKFLDETEPLECDAETLHGIVYFGDAPDYEEVERCELPAVIALELPGKRGRKFACEKHRKDLENKIREISK